MDDAIDQPEATGRFSRWAGNVLLLFVAIGCLVGIVTVFSAPAPLSLAIAVGAVATIGSLAATVRGLRNGRDWATPAAIVVLWLVVGQGVLETIGQAMDGTIHVAIGALLALIALLGAPAPPFALPGSRAGRRTLRAVLLVYLAGWFVPAATVWGLGPDAPWWVGRDALQVSVEIDCPGTGDDVISGTVRWEWSRADPFIPPVSDVVILQWGGSLDEHGNVPTLLSFESPTHPFESGEGHVPQVVEEHYAWQDNASLLVIDLATYGEGDGHATFAFDAGRAGEDATLGVGATYVHGDAWRIVADPVNCSWQGDPAGG